MLFVFLGETIVDDVNFCRLDSAPASRKKEVVDTSRIDCEVEEATMTRLPHAGCRTHTDIHP